MTSFTKTATEDYRAEAKEILVLTYDFPEAHQAPYSRYYLGAWTEDGVLHRESVGSINWSDDKDNPFAPFTLYRLLVRPHQHETGNFLLLTILQRDITDTALQTVRATLVEREAEERATQEALRESRIIRPDAYWQEEPFPAFGQYKASNQFIADMDWLGNTISVSLDQHPDDSSDIPPPAALATLRKLYAAPEKWQACLENWACDALLESARDWQDDTDDDGEPVSPLTAETFRQRIRLDLLSCRYDGSFAAWFDDGDLFAGHIIYVAVNPDGSFREATFMG